MARQSAKVAKSIPQGQVAESGRASAIKMAMEQIEKQYGKGSIMKFGDKNENLTIDVIPTGAFPLDIALGVGGLPRGRVVEIFGPEASGKTTVCLSLIAEAQKRGGVVAFIDAGSDIKPEGISMILSHFRWYRADIVIGSKRHPVSKVNYPWYRKILSLGYQSLIKILFGLSIRDSQVGLKLFRRQVLEDVLPRLLVKRFAFDIEILAVAHHSGYTRIFEAPVELDFTGVSTITSANFWKSIWSMLWDTLAVFYRLHILHYYDATNKRRWRYDPELDFRVNLP